MGFDTGTFYDKNSQGRGIIKRVNSLVISNQCWEWQSFDRNYLSLAFVSINFRQLICFRRYASLVKSCIYNPTNVAICGDQQHATDFIVTRQIQVKQAPATTGI